MVTANIFLHANFIVSDPVNDYTEMEIESVTARHAKITLNVGAGTATIGSFVDIPMTINTAQNTYECELKDLDNNTYYLLDIIVTNMNGNKTSKRTYINTGTNTKAYILRQNVSDGVNGTPVDNADVALTPQDMTLELDKWIEGLRDNMGNAIPEPVTAAERYTYLTTKVQGGQILRQTNHKGNFMYQALPNGVYSLEISKTGYMTITNDVTINDSNIVTGTWYLPLNE